MPTVNKRTRRTKLEWQVQPNRENHYLDARILARAAAAKLGIDRLASVPKAKKPTAAASSPPPDTRQAEGAEAAAGRKEGFWKKRKKPRGGGGGGSFWRR